MDVDGFLLDDKRRKAAENDIPDIINKWETIRHPERMSEANESKGVTSKAAKPIVDYRDHTSTPSLQSVA